MPPRRTPEQARERLMKAFGQALDRLLPPDAQTPPRLERFAEFEDATEEHAMPVLGMVLEEMAALTPSAESLDGGRCPHCGGTSSRPLATGPREVRSRWGPVVNEIQRFRCRACGRAFSPSAP